MATNIITSTICQNITDDFLIGTKIKLFSLSKIIRIYSFDENLKRIDLKYTSSSYNDNGYMYLLDIYEPFNYLIVIILNERGNYELHGFRTSNKANSSHFFFLTNEDEEHKIEAVNWAGERYSLNYMTKRIDDFYIHSVLLETLFPNRYSLVIDGEFLTSFFVGGQQKWN